MNNKNNKSYKYITDSIYTLPKNFEVLSSIIEETQLTGRIGDRCTAIFLIKGRRSGENIFDTNVAEDLVNYPLDKDGSVLFPNGKELTIQSSNNKDSGTVEVIYLDSLFDLKKKTVEISGKTKVKLFDKDEAYRIEWAHFTKAKNQTLGDITIEDSNQNIYEIIQAGLYSSSSGRFTVPNDYTAFLINWRPLVSKGQHYIKIEANVSLINRTLLQEKCWIIQDEWNGEDGAFYELNGNYMRFPEKSDIRMTSQSNLKSGSVSSQMNILLVKNSVDPALTYT